MRQVFTSPRLENVEAVAQLLRDAGIEVKVSNARSYRGNRRRTFSYRERGDTDSQAAVWIIRAEDQPRGRQLLRDAGLLDSSRDGNTSYLSAASLHDGQTSTGSDASRSMRIKLGLLLLIGVVIALIVFGARKYLPADGDTPQMPTPAKVATPSVIPEAVDALQTYRADVPTALVAKLVSDTIKTHAPTRTCISVDGIDPSAAALQALAATNTPVVADSKCGETPSLRIAVSEYMTDGSGSGTVKVSVDGKEPTPRSVTREGTAWQVND